MKKSDDRREFCRVRDEFNVRIAREVTGKKYRDVAIDVGKSINVSAKGILLTIKEHIDEDEIVRITFLKPNTFEFFENLARVVRVEKGDDDETWTIALNFENLTKEEMKRLDYYITLLKK